MSGTGRDSTTDGGFGAFDVEMRVTVVGPSLPRELSDRGTFHIHAEGCADLSRGLIRPYARDAWTLGVHSVLDVVSEVYADQIAESDDDDLDAYVHDFHFAPCTGALPYGPTPRADPPPFRATTPHPIYGTATLDADGYPLEGPQAPADNESRAREIAGAWHGGQASGLYAFSSSGYVSVDALSEAERIQDDLARDHSPAPGTYAAEIHALVACLRAAGAEDECPACKGNGIDPTTNRYARDWITCESCNGSGYARDL